MIAYEASDGIFIAVANDLPAGNVVLANSTECFSICVPRLEDIERIQCR